MAKKRALLVVAGGRGFPDVLALLGVQPHLVIILTSEEGWRDEQTFIEIASAMPDHEQVLPTLHLPSYDFDAIKQTCLDACLPYPPNEWEWTISIGSSPKIMGIAAYEAARQMSVPCIQADTQHEKIISLVKDSNISADTLFHTKVVEYMKIYRREPEAEDEEKQRYRKTVGQWGHIARSLALSPDASAFKKLMTDKKIGEAIFISPVTLRTSSLLKDLEHYGAIKIVNLPDGRATCEFTTSDYAKFLGTGDWLEAYTWHEAKEAKFADDCQWGYIIKSTASSELDVVITYKAQLLLVECKTNVNPFDTHYLDTIAAKAEMLGRAYVTKIFVTNASKKLRSYANFWEQAQLRKILVVTGEDLPNIGSFLKKQAINPDIPRI